MELGAPQSGLKTHSPDQVAVTLPSVVGHERTGLSIAWAALRGGMEYLCQKLGKSCC